jgi:putative transposase
MAQSAPRRTAAAQPLTEQRTLEFTVQLLTQHLALQAHGYCCATADLWRILVTAAARGSTVEATCRDLRTAPDSNTVRCYLNAQLAAAQVRALEAQCNAALIAVLPRWFRRRLRQPHQAFAIDLHDVPYYGQADQTSLELAPADSPPGASSPPRTTSETRGDWICRGEAQDGTTRFYRCATAYVILHNKRWTLAVTFVHPEDSLGLVLQRLLDQVRGLGLTRGELYLDKAFSSVAVLRYVLEETAFTAIIATPVRGKRRQRARSASQTSGSAGGTRALCHGRHSYCTDYTFHSAQHGDLQVPLGVVRTWSRRRDGQRHGQWLVYTLLRCRLPVHAVRQRYRKRFGIESSYRLLEEVRLRTTSPNAGLRFLAMGLALILGNVWIALHWQYLRVRGPGRPRVAREAFTLEQMKHFLVRAVEAIYGVIRSIHAPPDQIGIY